MSGGSNSHFSLKMTLAECSGRLGPTGLYHLSLCIETHPLCKNKAGTLRPEVGNADLLSVQKTYCLRLNNLDSSFRADIWEETSSTLWRFVTIGSMLNLLLEGWVESRDCAKHSKTLSINKHREKNVFRMPEPACLYTARLFSLWSNYILWPKSQDLNNFLCTSHLHLLLMFTWETSRTDKDNWLTCSKRPKYIGV